MYNDNIIYPMGYYLFYYCMIFYQNVFLYYVILLIYNSIIEYIREWT